MLPRFFLQKFHRQLLTCLKKLFDLAYSEISGHRMRAKNDSINFHIAAVYSINFLLKSTAEDGAVSFVP
jgi:hypothetical protein